MNRRDWLLKSGMALTGASLLPFSSFGRALPRTENETIPDGPITLCCNENPYGPSPAALKAMTDTVAKSNRYQWSAVSGLIDAIAAKQEVTTDNVVMGAGSTELLDLCVQLAATKKGSVVAADPSFTRWAMVAEQMGMQKVMVPLTADKHIDLPAMMAAIKPDTRMVYICNPNNPTGTLLNHTVLSKFAEAAAKTSMVVIDEAYLEFADGASLCKMAMLNKNLVVVKTFSKIYGLAGARIGYAIAHKETAQQLADQRCAFNIAVSAVSMAGAMASIYDTDFVRTTFERTAEARQYTIAEMEKLGIRCIPSYTNFIYFSLANYKKDFFDLLSKHKISATGIFEENGKWSRITVGTIDEMKKVIAAIS
jgi:histidinol-phosphate aminotransferase